MRPGHRARRPRRIAAALIGLLMGASAAVVADDQPEAARFHLSGVADWDSQMNNLRQLAWAMHASAGRVSKTPNGRTLADYADQWLLPDDVNGRLALLRDAATAAGQRGDAAAVSRLVEEAQPLLEVQLLRGNVIGTLWQLLYGIDAQTSALQPLLERAPAVERESIEARNGPMAAQAQTLVDAALAAQDPAEIMKRLDDSQLEITRVLSSYNEERLRLVDLLAGESPPVIPPMSWVRNGACPSPVKGTSRRAEPTFDKTTVVQPPFPDDAKAAGFDASITLAADVSATGCLERVAIARSSGTRALDQIAIDWARGLRYLPGEHGGRAVGGTFRFAVTFRLTDDFSSRQQLAPFDELPGHWDELGPAYCANPAILAFSADRRTMTLVPRGDARRSAPDGPPFGTFAVLDAAGDSLHLRRTSEATLGDDGKPVTWHLVLLDHTRFCWRRSDESPGACTAPAIRRCPSLP